MPSKLRQGVQATEICPFIRRAAHIAALYWKRCSSWSTTGSVHTLCSRDNQAYQPLHALCSKQLQQHQQNSSASSTLLQVVQYVLQMYPKAASEQTKDGCNAMMLAALALASKNASAQALDIIYELARAFPENVVARR